MKHRCDTFSPTYTAIRIQLSSNQIGRPALHCDFLPLRAGRRILASLTGLMRVSNKGADEGFQ
jgi:hypothetical protein